MASQAVHDHHKRLLVKLSDKLTREDCEKIVYLQNLPKKLEGKSSLKVLIQLEARGKTVEDIIEILKDINRHDVAKDAEELHTCILGRSQESPSDGKDPSLEAEGGPALAVKLNDRFEQQLEHLPPSTKAYLKDHMSLVLKAVLRQSLPTQSLTDSPEWEMVPSINSSTICNKCLQKSVAAECPKSPLPTRASQDLPNRCKASQGTKKPLLPPQKKMMGSHSSSLSSANLQKVIIDDNNREDKYDYTMPGVSVATPLCEKEKPHSKDDFLTDLNCQLKKRLETTQLVTGSSRIAKPQGTKPPTCPARPSPPARLPPPRPSPSAKQPPLERHPPPARPPPPRPSPSAKPPPLERHPPPARPPPLQRPPPPARPPPIERPPPPARPPQPQKPMQTTTEAKDIDVRSIKSDSTSTSSYTGDSGFFDGSNSLPKHSLHYSVVPVSELCTRLQCTSGYAPVITSEMDPETMYYH